MKKKSRLLSLGMALATNPKKKRFTFTRSFLWEVFNEGATHLIKDILGGKYNEKR